MPFRLAVTTRNMLLALWCGDAGASPERAIVASAQLKGEGVVRSFGAFQSQSKAAKFGWSSIPHCAASILARIAAWSKIC